jgi:hypothetical protein
MHNRLVQPLVHPARIRAGRWRHHPGGRR